jgi:hypothetical protein
MLSNEDAERLADIAAAKLGEHFDAVQILVSWNDEATSKGVFRGRGNWYARQGMAHEFITQDAGQVAAREIAHAMRPDDD